MVTSRNWVVKNSASGLPTASDFKLVTQELPACSDGEFIVEAEWVSVDPYVRHALRGQAVGDVVTGSQVARVIESKDPKYPVGSRVVGYFGWRSHTLLTDKDMKKPDFGDLRNYKLSKAVEGISLSTALGVLGMPGNTAYFGLLEICAPKSGDVVVVSAAAGAVGTSVCQIAKIKGCKVIAFAGSPTKVAWLRDLGVDVVANYKTDDVMAVLKKEAPKGVNCYFDGVGGEFSSKVFANMAQFGRVSVCGAISNYNNSNKVAPGPSLTSPFDEGLINGLQIKIEGFIVSRWHPRWDEGLQQMRQWIDQGKLKYKESITEGFDNIPAAFIGLFQGANVGKSVVKV